MTFPPRVVRARGTDGQLIRLAMSAETWNAAITDGDVEKLGQYLGLVQTGPEGLDAEVGLLSAHTLYQGLLRPLGGEVGAPDHYAYILRPPSSYTVVGERGSHMIVPEGAPTDSVFMVTVEIPPDPADPRLLAWRALASADVVGLIEDWSWFRADRREPRQPQNPNSRFHFRHWCHDRPTRTS